MNSQPDLFDDPARLGQIGAADGIRRSADHAEAEAPDWSQRATQRLQDYLREHPQQSFVAPDVRMWAESRGLDPPATNYAWGNVFRLAARSRLIVPVGYAQYGDERMHTQSVRVWRGA